MTTQTIKQKLFDYIRDAKIDEVKKLYANIREDVKYNTDLFDDENLVHEINKRSDELKSGKVKGIPWSMVKKNLNQK